MGLSLEEEEEEKLEQFSKRELRSVRSHARRGEKPRAFVLFGAIQA
jgi:hypothetical protein